MRSSGTTVRMDDVLLGIVLDRLDHQALADEPTDLLLAALEGEDALAAQLSATPGERDDPRYGAASCVTVGARHRYGALTTLIVHWPAASTLKDSASPGVTPVICVLPDPDVAMSFGRLPPEAFGSVAEIEKLVAPPMLGSTLLE